MKKNAARFVPMLAGLLLGAGAGGALGGVVSETTTTETTYRGTVTEVRPSSSTIVVSSATAEPRRYVYTEKTTFVDAAGNVVTREAIANQPVVIHYTRGAAVPQVEKVIVQRTAPVVEERRVIERPATVIEKRTETETVHELP